MENTMKGNKRGFIFSYVFAVIFSITNVHTVVSQQGTGTPAVPATPAAPSAPAADSIVFADKDVADAVRNEFKIRPLIPQTITVGISKGIIVLAGSTDNILTKDRAEMVASGVKGVKTVINRIIVTGGRPDGEIQKDIMTILSFNPATRNFGVEAQVDSGNVTLTGSVESFREIQLSGNVAKGVKGVRSVKNRIAMGYKPGRSDAEIANEIKQLISFDTRVNDALVNVSVSGGSTLLTGSVGSYVEKDIVRNMGWVSGVKSVDARGLNVDPSQPGAAFRKNKYGLKSDSVIQTALRTVLLYDPYVKYNATEVSVQNGIVTLNGVVDNLSAKMIAEEDAKNVVGVKNVINNITVTPGVNYSPDSLKNIVATAFSIDPYTSVNQINISSIGNGAVALDGSLGTYYEKFHAEDVASRLIGVKEIINNLKVSNNLSYLFWNDSTNATQTATASIKPAKSDSEIKAEIIRQLQWSPYINGNDVNVEVQNGKAILTGTVESNVEETSAVENAYEGGAVSVENRLKKIVE